MTGVTGQRVDGLGLRRCFETDTEFRQRPGHTNTRHHNRPHRRLCYNSPKESTVNCTTDLKTYYTIQHNLLHTILHTILSILLKNTCYYFIVYHRQY